MRERQVIGWLLLVVAGTLAAPGKQVEVGINDATGKPIYMRLGMTHPVMATYRRDAQQRPDAKAVAAATAALGKYPYETFGDRAKWNPGQVPPVVAQGFLLLDGKAADTPEFQKACAGVQAFLGAVTPDDILKGGKGFAENVAGALLFLGECKVPVAEQRRLAEPLFQAVLKNAFLRWKRPCGDLALWDLGVVEVLYWSPCLSAADQQAIRDAVYSTLPADGGQNNNGRWGRFMDWPVALAFEDADLMREALKAFKHWLGFNLYPSGVVQDWESYDYAAGGKDDGFVALSQQLIGLDAATFRIPQYPVADGTQRFGFEDHRDPRALPGTIWKDMNLFRQRWSNHLPPDSKGIGINDTQPGTMSAPSSRVTNFNLASVNLRSSAILRGGPAPDAARWDEPHVAGDPASIMKTFWAYLHADPSDAIHNHYDINQLLLWWNGVFLAGPSGCDCSYECGTYNRKNGLYATYTYSSNTVTVDQQPQYIAHGTVTEFGVTPGFRFATTDAGYVYDGVFHQRTIAQLPEYLVDLNLLPARDPADKAVHTFDYMMSGTGEFEKATGWDDYENGRLWTAWGQDEQSYLRWPNLLHIYPYITWGRTRAPKQDWDVSWGEAGRNLRMMVAELPGASHKACLGRAQLAHRGAVLDQRLLNGVPKVLVRKEGPSANFLVLYEPHGGQSAIRGWKRLDERACEVELTNGLTDVVCLRRQAAAQVWVRYAKKLPANDPPRATGALDVLNRVAVANGRGLKLDANLTVFESDQPLTVLLDYGVPEARTLYVYADCPAPTRLTVALNQQPQATFTFGAELKPSWENGQLVVQLPQGVSRLRVTTPFKLLMGTAPGAFTGAGLATQLGLGEVKEATTDWQLNQSKLLAEFPYQRPRVYADGAYLGMKGVAPWTVALTNDGQFAVVGSHDEYIEALSPGGRLWRTYVKGRSLIDYNYASPHPNCIGRGHYGKPLTMTGDGSRIYVGTDAAKLYCLDRDGRILWDRETKFRVQSVALSADGSRIAVAADVYLALYDAAGKLLFERTAEKTGTIDVLQTRDGQRLFASDTEGTIECLDPAGQLVWRYTPGLKDTGGVHMYRSAMKFHDIAVDAAGVTLAGVHGDYGIYCLDAKTGVVRWRFQAESGLNDVAISDDGRTIVGLADGEIFCLDAAGKLQWKFVCGFLGYAALAMTPDGKYVAAVDPLGEWFLLSREGKLLSRTPLRTPEPNSVAMTPDGKYVAIAGIGYDVYLFANRLE